MGVIVGPIVGAIGILLLALAGLLYLRRRRRRQLSTVTAPEPFLSPPNSSVPHTARSTEKSYDVFLSPNAPASLRSADYVTVADDGSSYISLQRQVQVLEAELAALRSRDGKSQIGSEDASNSGGRTVPTSQGMSSLASEVANLRAEITQLKMHQDDPARPVQGPQSDNLQREINILRSEIEEIRFQQMDTLPEYSPPLPRHTGPHPLPGP